MKPAKEAKVKADIIVLMAGEGRRMLPLTADRPKGLLCSDAGISIFHHNVQVVVAQDWDTTVIPVIGHGGNKVIDEMVRLKELATFAYVYNPFYASAGPLVSLWLGLMQSKNHGVVIMNGDTLIEGSLMEKVVSWMTEKTGDKPPDMAVCVSPADHFAKDDMKVLLDEKGCFARVSKDVPPGPEVVVSAGVVCVRDAPSKGVLKCLINKMIRNKGSLQKNYYWHNLLNEGKEKINIDVINVNVNSWHEVDTPADLHTSRSFRTG